VEKHHQVSASLRRERSQTPAMERLPSKNARWCPLRFTGQSRSTSATGVRYNTPMDPRLEELRPETIDRLAQNAQAEGLSLDAYLNALLGLLNEGPALAERSEAEFEAFIEDCSKGSEHFPPLPPDLSPHTSKIARRCGSKAKATRHTPSSASNRGSFMLAWRDPFRVSTRGRPQFGPNSSSNKVISLAAG
jgi:hypothetical protein